VDIFFSLYALGPEEKATETRGVICIQALPPFQGTANIFSKKPEKEES
jgi:hypothetical protein